MRSTSLLTSTIRRYGNCATSLDVIIVDTSVWVAVLRDASKRGRVERALAGDDAYLTRFTRLELLMGASREEQRTRLERYLDVQMYVEADSEAWCNAARTYFDLRCVGKMVHSPIDCCIAEAGMAHDALLLHQDRDFTTIATVRPLRERWIEFWEPSAIRGTLFAAPGPAEDIPSRPRAFGAAFVALLASKRRCSVGCVEFSRSIPPPADRPCRTASTAESIAFAPASSQRSRDSDRTDRATRTRSPMDSTDRLVRHRVNSTGLSKMLERALR